MRFVVLASAAINARQRRMTKSTGLASTNGWRHGLTSEHELSRERELDRENFNDIYSLAYI